MKSCIMTIIASFIFVSNCHALNVCAYKGTENITCNIVDIELTQNNTVIVTNKNNERYELNVDENLKLKDIDCVTEFKVINNKFYYSVDPELWLEVPMI